MIRYLLSDPLLLTATLSVLRLEIALKSTPLSMTLCYMARALLWLPGAGCLEHSAGCLALSGLLLILISCHYAQANDSSIEPRRLGPNSINSLTDQPIRSIADTQSSDKCIGSILV